MRRVLLGALGCCLACVSTVRSPSAAAGSPTTVSEPITEPEPEPEPEPMPMTETEPAPSEPSAFPARPGPAPTHTLAVRESADLGDGFTLEVENVVVESLEPSPDGVYPGGGAVQVDLLLRRELHEKRVSLLDITQGYEPKLVGWLDDFRVRLVEVEDMHTNPRVALVIEAVGEARTGVPPTRHRVARGESFGLGEGDRVQFTGHSHKRTRPGQTSPLIVHLDWLTPGQEPVTDYVSLRPSGGDRTWRWRDLELTLVSWDYNAWIEVDVRRFERHRVAAPQSAALIRPIGGRPAGEANSDAELDIGVRSAHRRGPICVRSASPAVRRGIVYLENSRCFVTSELQWRTEKTPAAHFPHTRFRGYSPRRTVAGAMKITRPPKSIVGIAGFVALTAACQEPVSEPIGSEARDGDLALEGTVGRFETRAMTMLDGTARIVHYLIEGNDEYEIILPDGMEIPRDAVVRAYGDSNADGVLEVAAFDVIELAPEPLIDAEPYGPRRIATILLTWEGAGGIGNGVAEQDMYTGERSTNVFYAENSYGKETMAGRVFGPYTIDQPPSCSSTGIANAALQVFAERGHREDDWDQIMYYFPGLSGCGWSGLASVGSVEFPAKNSWYNGSFGCVVRNQELGHNYGMGHSHAYSCPDGVTLDAEECSHVEYGDPYDPMGGGCRHINAVQKGFMGWLEGCNFVNGSQTGLYNVAPLEVPCNGTQALRFPTTDGRWYYLEYRQPIGEFDTSLSGGVIAHVAGDINNFGPSPYILDLGLGGLMQEGDSFSDPGGGITFTVVEDNGTHAVIQVDYPEGAEQSEPTCIDGTEPEMAQGAVGSLECADGPYPGDSEPPTVTITAPTDGDVFAPGSDFLITAEPEDDRGIIELELYINGEPQFKLYEPPWEWDVTNIPEGVYEFGIVARDSRFWAPSQAVTVDVGIVEDPTDSDSDGESSGGGTDSGTSGPATTGEPEPEDDDTDGGSGSGGDAAADDGGGCRTGGPGAPLSALLLLGFGWMRRRR